MIQPLFDKNQIFQNIYDSEKESNQLISNHESSYINTKLFNICIALGVDYDEFIQEYENFKKSIDN